MSEHQKRLARFAQIPQSGRLPLNGIDGLLILFVMFIFLSFTLFLFRVHDFPNLMIGI